ncbi:MAG: hypothetical protein V7L23_15855 [Nostoc sp.]|uniref:hypothetical protein n=1 Tax=Nostoc sp. TaxID=1180 RepID=UPI002FF06FD0
MQSHSSGYATGHRRGGTPPVLALGNVHPQQACLTALPGQEDTSAALLVVLPASPLPELMSRLKCSTLLSDWCPNHVVQTALPHNAANPDQPVLADNGRGLRFHIGNPLDCVQSSVTQWYTQKQAHSP